MADAQSEDTELNTEALKLLVQVACANDHIHPKERELLVKLGKAWRVPEVVEMLFAHLDGGTPLPQPNLAVLRPHADKVLRAAGALVAVDGEVDADENDVLAQLKMLLGRA